MMNNYHNILSAVYNKPWAILPDKFAHIDNVLQLRLKGAMPIDADAFKAEFEAAAARRETRSAGGGAVAVIPIVGTIMHRAGAFEASGGISVQTIQKQITTALGNSAVGSIVFDVDSPGGSVDGVPELAEFIRANRGDKPMIGVANTLMASAAFWIGAQFDELVASPSAEVGSIGVMAQHIDQSALNEAMGIKVTTITNGSSPNKATGNPHAPLEGDALDEIQGLVDSFAEMFEKAVAKGRGVSVSKVQSNFGGGSIFNAEDAKANGLVDRIGTLDETIARMASSKPRRNLRAARQREIEMM